MEQVEYGIVRRLFTEILFRIMLLRMIIIIIIRKDDDDTEKKNILTKT